MPIKIKTINIHGFRGIPNLELDFGGKSLLLKGDNGTGKSSIVEAFEFFFTGKLSILEGKGTQNLSLSKHAPHKNFAKEDVSIKIAFTPGSVTLERTFETEPKPAKQLEKYIEVAQKGTFILHRSQILKFIASVPSERFKAIASIIGVEQLDNVELAMKRAYEELDTAVRLKRERIQRIFESISEYLGEDIADINQVLDSINRELKRVSLTQLTSLDEVNKVTDEILEKFNESADIERAGKLTEIIDKLKLSMVDEEIVENLECLNEKLRPFLEGKSERELSLGEFLIRGKQAVKQDERNICPLCGQRIDRQRLEEQIEKRLQTLKELSEEASEVRQLSTILRDKLLLLINNIEESSSMIEKFEELNSVYKKLLRTKKLLTRLLDRVGLANKLKLDKQIAIEEFERCTDMIEKSTHLASTKCQRLLKKIGIPKEWKEKMEVSTLITRISTLISELAETKKDLANEEKQCNIAKKVYVTFSETKKAKLIEIYDSISEDVNAFYSTLHPNEQHKNIELKVASGRRASTELKMESFGSVEEPRAFASEGHLDSLGLCIFLAFTKKFDEGCDFIVLDDVVTTIDAQHRGLLCKLLFEKFREYQLFITTHDAIWFDQLCAHQRAFEIGGDFKNMEIVRWTLANGPVLEPYKTRWDHIQNKIRSNDKHGAANDGRRYLEWLLKAICERLKVKPVFKIDRRAYTVSDLFAPAKIRVKKLLKDISFKEDVLKCFQELEATTIIGNLLSHDNIEAEVVSMKEVERFCIAVHKLHSIFTCQGCKTLLKYYQDMKRIRCPSPICEQPTEVMCK